MSILAFVVAAAATVLTASRRELLAHFALPHSQTHGLLTLIASATYSRAAFDTVSYQRLLHTLHRNQQLQYAEALLVKVNKLRQFCHQPEQSGQSPLILRA